MISTEISSWNFKCNEQYIVKILNYIENNRNSILRILSDIETYKTAQLEVEWSISALKKFILKKDFLQNLNPMGKVYISLPANLPLYSFIIYVLEAAYIGNIVKVRPSSKSKKVLLDILKESNLDKNEQVKLTDISWNLFMKEVNDRADIFIFTGSWNNAKKIEGYLSDTVKYIYNGSGVCPFVVGPNANIHDVVIKIIQTKFFNSGQDCMATECVYLHKSLYKEVARLLVEKVNNLKVGPNAAHDTDVGPLMFLDNLMIIDKLVEEKKGVIKVLKRGGLKDNYYHPCIVECSPYSYIATEEKFGPVLPIVCYDNDKELYSYLSLRNHELGISIFGQTSIIPNLGYGHITIDKTLYDYENSIKPFGGYKRSGFVKHHGFKKEGPISIVYETSGGLL